MTDNDILDMQNVIETIRALHESVEEILVDTKLSKNYKEDMLCRIKVRQLEVLKTFSDYVIKATAYFVQEGKIDEANKLFKDYVDNIDKVNELIDKDIEDINV